MTFLGLASLLQYLAPSLVLLYPSVVYEKKTQNNKQALVEIMEKTCGRSLVREKIMNLTGGIQELYK